jgi:hypothetical protein
MKKIIPDYSLGSYPEVEYEPSSGWELFTPEVTWFVYDFFKHDLNGYEKILFYCYYIQGMTMTEIAGSADCSFQYIGAQMKKIEKKMQHRWKNKDTWTIPRSEV